MDDKPVFEPNFTSYLSYRLYCVFELQWKLFQNVMVRCLRSWCKGKQTLHKHLIFPSRHEIQSQPIWRCQSNECTIKPSSLSHSIMLPIEEILAIFIENKQEQQGGHNNGYQSFKLGENVSHWWHIVSFRK